MAHDRTPWDLDHAEQYGWNSLTRLHPYANRAAGFASAVGAFIAVGAGNGPIRIAGIIWSATIAQAITIATLSRAANIMRSPRCVYRLRDDHYRVLYIGRSKAWFDRLDAHQNTADDHDEPWRWKINEDTSAPFKWCHTPWGEWYSERFRIRQAATLHKLGLAPKIHNDRRQHNRSYRSPMAAVAVLLWAAEELAWGTQPTRGNEEKDPRTGDSYEPEPVHTDQPAADDSTEEASATAADAAETVDDEFARLVAAEWPDWQPGVAEPVADEASATGPSPLGDDQGCCDIAQRATPDAIDLTGSSDPGPIATPSRLDQPASAEPAAAADGAGSADGGSTQSPSGAAGGKPCSGNGFGQPCPDSAPAAKGPRCADCHREYNRLRAQRLRRRTDGLFGEEGQ